MSVRFALLLLSILLALGLLLRLTVEPGGSLGLPESGIVWGIRLDRAIAALIVGVSLGAAGVALQAMLRNPLASPDLLGMSAGAVLMVTLGRALGLHLPDELAALLGAIGALGLVLLLGRRRGQVEPMTLILVGVALAIGLGSLASAVRAALPPSARPEDGWLFGTLTDGLTTQRLVLASIVALCGVAWIGLRGRALDASAMGEDEAITSGVPLRRLRIEMIIVAGALTAVAVVLAGPIAFLGLVCPHLVRMVMGPRHAPLAIGAAMAGAILMLVADSIVRVMPLETGRLPTGVVVAVLAAPALIVILRSQASRPG